MTVFHTSRTKSLIRTFSLALVVAVCGAVFAPAAFATHKPDQQSPRSVTHRHFPKLYKVEKTFDLEEEQFAVQHDASTHISCDENNPNDPNDNDIATDGMWTILDYDQDEFGNRPFEDAWVYASYGDYLPVVGPPAYPNGNPSRWHFEFYNDGINRAQIKFWVTCIGYRTEPNSHRHNWFWQNRPPQTVTEATLPAGTGRRVVEASVGGNVPGSRCPVGYIAIAPGFQWDRLQGAGYIYASHYTGPAPTPGNPQFRRWKWGFWEPVGPYSLTLSLRCLRLDTSTAVSHKHELVYDFEPSYPMSTIPPRGIDPLSVETEVVDCDAHEKGMVHSFTLDLNDNLPHDLWFLGMDPRIKSRAYKIENKGANQGDAYLGLMCFNDRTGKRIKP